MALSFRATAQRRLRRQTVLASQMPVLALPVCRMISAVALPIGCQGPVTFARPDMLLRTPPNETTASSQLSPVAAPV